MKTIGTKLEALPELSPVLLKAPKDEPVVHALRKVMPTKRITDPSFTYRRACDTNLDETFRLAREKMRGSK